MLKEHQPTEKYYDKLAAIYDQATADINAWTPPKFIAQAIKDLHNFNSVLIIGVGTGKDIEALKDRIPSHIEGIDISSEMLKVCHGKFPDTILHHDDFMDFSDFSLKEYDLIICSGTLEFIKNFEDFFSRCSKFLKKDGTLIVTFEPLIFNHKIQLYKESKTVPNQTSKLSIDGFLTYRRTLMQFFLAIKQAGFILNNHFEFVSYQKLETDIIYHFAELRHIN